MLDKMIYEYAIIRYLPKVEREEFLNIGVIVLCKKRNFLQLKYSLNEDRITAFTDVEDISFIKDYLEAWKLVCAGGPEGGRIGELEIRVRFRWLTASRSSIIQSSKVHPGLCEDPLEVLNDLFERYVK